VSAVVVYFLFLHLSFLPLFLYFSIYVYLSCFRDWFAISSFYSFILSSFPPQKKNADKEFNDPAQFQVQTRG